MNPSRPLLLVADDLGRGELPLFVLRLCRWLQDHGEDVRVVAWRGGPLLAELRSVCPVRVVDDLNRWWLARVLQLVGLGSVAARVKGLRLRASCWRLARRRRVLVVGAAAGRAVGYFVGQAEVITSLPGGAGSLAAELGEQDRRVLLERTTGFIVPTDTDLDGLVAEHQVDPSSVRVVPPFMPLPSAVASPEGARGRIGLPEGAVVVGGTGTDDWWRAPDPFVVIAWELVRRRPDLPLHFVWACADDDADALWPLRHDIANAGLEDRFHLATEPPLADDLVAADVVVVTTREESLRLVALDVALAARPVVGVAPEGRPDELGPGAVLVPYLDVDAAATEVLALLDDPARAAALADAARSHMGWARDAAEAAPAAMLRAVDDLVG